MNKNHYLALIFADLFTIFSFFAGAKFLVDYSLKYQKTTDSPFIFIIPASILSLFIVLRIIKTFAIISGKSNVQFSHPLAASGVTLFGALLGIPQISDLIGFNLFIIPFSFMFSFSVQKDSYKIYRRLRYLTWFILLGTPTFLFSLAYIQNRGNPNFRWISETGVEYLYIFFFIIFAFVLDSLLKRKEKQAKDNQLILS